MCSLEKVWERVRRERAEGLLKKKHAGRLSLSQHLNESERSRMELIFRPQHVTSYTRSQINIFSHFQSFLSSISSGRLFSRVEPTLVRAASSNSTFCSKQQQQLPVSDRSISGLSFSPLSDDNNEGRPE